MLIFFETHRLVISIFLFSILLAALLFLPGMVGAIAVAILLLGPGWAIFFIVHSQMQAHRAGSIDRPGLVRNIFFEVLSLLLAIALAIFLVQVVVGLVGPLTGGGLIGMVITIVAAVLVGLAAAWLVQATWGRLIKSMLN